MACRACLATTVAVGDSIARQQILELVDN